jgi:hypothetical protein
VKLPLSKFGLVIALIYAIVAVLIVREDRRSTAGGWITLRGMGAYLITLPVSALGEKLGIQPDHRRNLDMVIAIGLCATTVYLLGAGLAKLAVFLFVRILQTPP